MNLAGFLLQDYDIEARGMRSTLERVPPALAEFRPHEKSLAMGRLAMHVATLPDLGRQVISSPDMDLAQHTFPAMVFTTTEAALDAFDRSSADLRATLATLSDEHLQGIWKLSYGDRKIAEAPRSLLFRTMFFNHAIHHRAQLGVYLRLNNLPVPPLYGPSADDRMGF